MIWLKAFTLNIVALALAALVGAVAVSQIVYMHQVQVGSLPIAPFVRGVIVSIIVSAAAPPTSFRARFFIFSGVYILDLALSVAAAAVTIELVNSYFDGDPEAAKPWVYGGAIIPFMTGVAAFFALQRYRAQPLRDTDPGSMEGADRHRSGLRSIESGPSWLRR